MSPVSHDSVMTSKLLLDEETRLDIFSRFGRKLRALVKVTDKERLFDVVEGRGLGKPLLRFNC